MCRVKKTLLLFFLLSVNISAQANQFLRTLWGTPPPNSLYLGMWTYHVNDTDRVIYKNDLLMLVYRSFFAGTLINCYNDRTYIFGVQRYVFENHFGCGIDSQLGYRAGLIYGYDERLMPIAGTLKLLPCAQIIYDLGWKHVGVEFTFTGVIVSAGFSIRF